MTPDMDGPAGAFQSRIRNMASQIFPQQQQQNTGTAPPDPRQWLTANQPEPDPRQWLTTPNPEIVPIRRDDNFDKPVYDRPTSKTVRTSLGPGSLRDTQKVFKELTGKRLNINRIAKKLNKKQT
jgi:hypothetical protein